MTDRVALTVNLGQMAQVLHLSVKGMRALLARSPDFPVLAHGSAGVGYSFDPVAVIEFVQRHRTAPAALSDQLVLFQELPRCRGRRISTRDRIQELQLLRLERMEVEASARLVVQSDLRRLLLEHLDTWDRLMGELLDAFREDGLSDPAANLVRAAWVSAAEALRRNLAWLLRDTTNMHRCPVVDDTSLSPVPSCEGMHPDHFRAEPGLGHQLLSGK